MQRATTSDLAEIKTLLEENGLPSKDITGAIQFFIIRKNKQLIAVGGLENCGDDLLLRSIAIAEGHKNKGLGAQITRFLIEQARINGNKAIYLLTMTAKDYFPRFGFTTIDRSLASKAIKNSSEFTTVCPSSASLMRLKLK
jgi:amino-acid N-acetyltransferase